MLISTSHTSRCVSSLLLLALCLTTCRDTPEADKAQNKGQNSLEVAWNNIPQISSAAFVGADAAWFVTYKDGNLLFTEDGGGNWSKVPAEVVGRFDQISFIDALNGWAISKLNGQGIIWRTNNGGRTWVEISKISSPDPAWSFISAVQIKFVDNLQGWLVETFTIWRTEDGGASWNQVFVTSMPQVSGQPVRGFFRDAYQGWICGTKGQIYHTRDGGNTWDIQTVDENADLSDIFFVNESVGWLSRGANSQLYHSNDEGKSWRPQLHPENSSYIDSIYFISPMEGWVVGRGLPDGSSGLMPADIDRNVVHGIVLHTLDGGKSWQTVQVSDNDTFFAQVHFANAHDGWLIARDRVYRTIDGGKNWYVCLDLPPVKSIE